jgi:transposase
VKPFSKGQKNDYNDAEAIAEAALRPNLKLVKEKTQEQLDLQACHRVRSRLVSRRTATINQIRAFLIEQGIALRSGASALRTSLPEILRNRADEISPRMRELTVDLHEYWLRLDARIEAVTHEIEQISKREKSCQKLMTVPGTVDLDGHGGRRESWRRLRARPGLRCLVGVGPPTILDRWSADPRASFSKRGSKYLRSLFIQAANVILIRPKTWEKFSFGAWLTAASARMHRNKLAAALANKLARIAWSVLRHNKRFDEAMAI